MHYLRSSTTTTTGTISKPSLSSLTLTSLPKNQVRAYSLCCFFSPLSQSHGITAPLLHAADPPPPPAGEQKLKDFDIEREAKGVDKGVKINFKAIVKDKSLEIHFYYAGKGTTAVLMRGIYVPLISAISVKSGTMSNDTSKFTKAHTREDRRLRAGHLQVRVQMENDADGAAFDGVASESILAEKVKSQEEKVKSQEEQLTAANERIRQLAGQYADIREMVRQLKETPEEATGSNTNQR
ncbi:hypothetical protein LguiB_006136 [Lonicera macranthoides]